MSRFLNPALRLAWLLGVWPLTPGCAHKHIEQPPAVADSGRTRFEAYCAGCHLNEGSFMMGEAPPLDGSEWVAGPEDRLIKIALHGLHGKIEVRGKDYNQEMPSFGPILSDSDIAALLSYVRHRYGGGASPVSPAEVTRIRDANRNRTGYWTVAELLKEP